jgi:hypothetical protein
VTLLTAKYHIRSVLAKLNASNFFASKNQNLVENVITFGLPGFAQSIVLDTHG